MDDIDDDIESRIEVVATASSKNTSGTGSSSTTGAVSEAGDSPSVAPVSTVGDRSSAIAMRSWSVDWDMMLNGLGGVGVVLTIGGGDKGLTGAGDDDRLADTGDIRPRSEKLSTEAARFGPKAGGRGSGIAGGGGGGGTVM